LFPAIIKIPLSISGHGLAPAKNLTLLTHYTLGSWDMFLSLFPSRMEGPSVDIILLQDTLSAKGFLPRFSGFKFFSPPVGRPQVPCYVSQRFLRDVSLLPVFFPESDDWMALNVYTPRGCYRSTFPRFRVGNASASPIDPPT